MNETSIEWVKNPDGSQGYTWNPITGCLNHTPDGLCLGGGFPCYAYRLANGRLRSRYLANKNTIMQFSDGYAPMKLKVTDPFYPRFWEDRLYEIKRPLSCIGHSKLQKPKGIFVCDMSDLFGIGIPKEWTNQVLWAIKERPEHRFYLLTKQPQNLIKFSPFPDNCWVGVSATNRTLFDTAVYYLAEVAASVKYISFEPLLESAFYDEKPFWGGTDWVIIGAQTKSYKLPKIEWAKEIVEACNKAGIPVFLKDNLKPLLKELPESCIRWAGWGEYTHRELRQEMPK